MQRIGDDGQVQGLRIVADAVLRPRRDPQALREGPAPRVQRRRRRRAARRAADAVPQRQLPDRRRVPQPRRRRRARAARRVARQPRRSAARAAQGLARAGERAGWCIERPRWTARRAGWPRGGLWRHRDFLLLWSAQGISAVGSRITRTALPMAAILVAGAGAFDLGFLTVALTLPGALLAWFGGGFVDRHRRRPLMIGADLVRARRAAVDSRRGASRAALAAAALRGRRRHRHRDGALQLADHVFITDLVGRKRLLDANGKREAVDAVAEISGPGARRRAGRVADRADRDRRRRRRRSSCRRCCSRGSASARRSRRRRRRRRSSTTSAPASASSGAMPTVRALFLATATLTFCMSFMASLYTLFALSDLGLDARRSSA